MGGNMTSTCSTSWRSSDFNFGAMENKGLNIFNSRYILADPDTATDEDYDAIAAWWRMNISTTGRATASPAGTGSSSP